MSPSVCTHAGEALPKTQPNPYAGFGGAYPEWASAPRLCVDLGGFSVCGIGLSGIPMFRHTAVANDTHIGD